MLTSPIVWIVAGYLLGSIPFGLLLARAAGIDIRQVGSGNIGATNVLRTGNKGLAAATLLLDAGKGFAAVWLAQRVFFMPLDPMPAWCGLAAFVGHLFPVWLGLRGGKGVATMLGVTLAIAWPLGLVSLAVWLLAALATRYSSVGGMAAALVAPSVIAVLAVVLGTSSPVAWVNLTLFSAMAVLLVWKHRDNIARLRAGTEPKIGQKA